MAEVRHTLSLNYAPAKKRTSGLNFSIYTHLTYRIVFVTKTRKRKIAEKLENMQFICPEKLKSLGL